MNDDDLSAYADDIETPSDDVLKRVSDLASLQQQQNAEIEALEKQLKVMQAALKQTEEVDLPDAMNQAGIATFKTTKGVSVSLKTFYLPSVNKANEDAFYGWLEQTGQDGIVKVSVLIPTVTDAQTARAAISALAEQGYAAEIKRDIHAMTFRAFVKELVESGRLEVPPSLSYLRVTKASVKAPKSSADGAAF